MYVTDEQHELLGLCMVSIHDQHGLILLLGSLILVMTLLMEKYKNVMGPVGLYTLLTTCTFLYIHCIHSPIAICIAAG